jgi:hypothetical protein
MTHKTEDFEDALELKNVNAVEYNESSDEVIAFVSKKVPQEELKEEDVVSRNIDKKTRVVEIGHVYTERSSQGTSPRGKNRPVRGGSSELNTNIRTAGTAGPYPVEVVDTSKAFWGENVNPGDIVRLSNNHVYARSNDAEIGEDIQQPSPADGGSKEDIVGELVGYVPLQDGVTVDVASRSTDTEVDSQSLLGLGDRYMNSVFRGDYNTLLGDTLVKTGRTSSVTRGKVLATSATTVVSYPHGKQYKMRDLIITEDMSRGGDSGAPVYREDGGEIVGMLFSGSETVTVFCKATNIEKEHGVRIMEHNKDNREYEKPGEEYVESLRSNVSIGMDEHDLDIVSMSGEKPSPGEQFNVTISVVGNRDGMAYLDVQDETAEFELSSGEEKDVTLQVTAPYEHGDAFDLDVRGGYIFSDN